MRGSASFALACALAFCALPAPAARVQDQTNIAAVDVPFLRGKTLAITQHAPPAYLRSSRGTILFNAILAPAAWQDAGKAAKGKDFIADNALPDPSGTAREMLAIALRDVHGLQPIAPDVAPTEATKPKALAALHPDVDYVLDVRTLRWEHIEGPKKNAYVRLWMELQLVNVATGHTVAWMRCDNYSSPDLNYPVDKPVSFAAVEADGGRTLRHMYAVQAARCARKFAVSRLLISRERMGDTMALADADAYAPPSQ